MADKDMKIVVIGAGAIGGITAACISRAGYDVEIVCKHEHLARTIESRGLHITGVKGDFYAKMKAVPTVDDLEGIKDLVLIATKATDLVAVATDLLPYLGESSLVVSLQNGLCEDTLAEIVDKKRTVGCVVGWGATMHGLGELEMTSTGEFVIGTINGTSSHRLNTVKTILDTVVPVEISDNIKGNLYSKLMINACITSLGAICGLYLGEMLANRKIRSIFLEIQREALVVAQAMDLKVEVYANKIDWYSFLTGESFLSSLKRHLLIRIIGFKFRRLKSSSLQSLERGKPTEIDWLNGYISKNGQLHNVPTPVNDSIVRLIKEIEQGKRSITIKNFDEPFFHRFN